MAQIKELDLGKCPKKLPDRHIFLSIFTPKTEDALLFDTEMKKIESLRF